MHVSPSSSSLVQSPRKVSLKMANYSYDSSYIHILFLLFSKHDNDDVQSCVWYGGVSYTLTFFFFFTIQGFKPSKLLFGDAENESKEQQMTSSLTTEPKDRPADRKSQTSVLTAIESCGGFSGALVTFQCMVQRVYCKRAKISKDKTTNYRYKHAGLT